MRKFEIPYNFDKELLKELETRKECIKLIYLPCFYADGDNSRYDLLLNNQIPRDWNEYLEHLQLAQVIAPAGLLIQRNSTIEVIDKYYNLGIRYFIINNDELAQEIKKTYADAILILSITAYGEGDWNLYDEIVLPFHYCRQVQKIAELPQDKKYVLIPNSHCLWNCNRHAAHWGLTADSLEEYQTNVMKIIDGYCGNVYNEDRAFIKPEDLIYFDSYIDTYKLVDRLDLTEEILYNIDRYSKEYSECAREINWYQKEDEV